MKNCVFHFVMAILEGGLSGAVFFEAKKETQTKRKVLLLLTSIGWFILSLADAFQGGQALRQLREAKSFDTDGGDDND